MDFRWETGDTTKATSINSRSNLAHIQMLAWHTVIRVAGEAQQVASVASGRVGLCLPEVIIETLESDELE